MFFYSRPLTFLHIIEYDLSSKPVLCTVHGGLLVYYLLQAITLKIRLLPITFLLPITYYPMSADYNHKHVMIIKIRHTILIQCPGNYIEMEKFHSSA